jgi:hypothetical protein
VGLFGGGVKAKEIEVPKISNLARVFSVLIGVVMLGVAIWLSFPAPSDETTPTPITDVPMAPKPMIVEVTADPTAIPPGASTVIRVEVLSAPNSPIEGATVRIQVGGGIFSATNDLEVTGTTNFAGFFAAEWQCPPSAPSPYGYYFTITASKAGYEETSLRFLLDIR